MLCSANSSSTGIVQSPREENDAPAWRRKSTWRCTVLAQTKITTLLWRETSNHASFTLPDTGPRNRAALAGHCGRTADEDCWRGARTKGLFWCERRRRAFKWKLYARLLGNSSTPKTTASSLAPWARYLAAAWSLEPVNWVTRLKAVLPFFQPRKPLPGGTFYLSLAAALPTLLRQTNNINPYLRDRTVPRLGNKQSPG